MRFPFEIKLVGQIRGTLRVDDTGYNMDVPLGFRQRLFEGRARAAIERWLDENLPYPGLLPNEINPDFCPNEPRREETGIELVLLRTVLVRGVDPTHRRRQRDCG